MPEIRVFDPPAGPFAARVSVPGDKSLGHRALILAAMASGDSTIANLSLGADIVSTRRATLGLGVRRTGDLFRSPGIAGWHAPSDAIDCGNSGSTMRMLAGALAGSRVSASLVGDASLNRRPMERLLAPLESLGARISVAPGGTPPVTVQGTDLCGTSVTLPIASAQVRTAVAFAALNATGPTTISSPPGFRDHTERWLVALGLGDLRDEQTLVVRPGAVPPISLTLPGDPSSAAFLWAAAAVRPGAEVVTPGVSLNPGRTGFLEVLGAMGADVAIAADDAVLTDPVGTVTVRGRGLVATDISGTLAVRTLDELPLVAVLAAAATGTTTVSDAAELRVKESDRIDAAVALALTAGGLAEATPDGFVVSGGDRLASDTIDAKGDHRIALAAGIAAIVRGAPLGVRGYEIADVSWPGFESVLEALWS